MKYHKSYFFLNVYVILYMNVAGKKSIKKKKATMLKAIISWW